MPTPLFPTSVRMEYPLDVEAEYATIVNTFGGDNYREEVRRSLHAFPMRRVGIKASNMFRDEVKVLWDFYTARRGAYEAFHFFLPTLDYWTGEFVAVQTIPGTTTFDLPGMSVDEPTLIVYDDGVITAITFSGGTGENGADQVIFAPAPVLGSIITADIYGQLRMKMRFKDDKLTKGMIELLLYQYKLELMEVRN